jgi:CBS domain-containing protein
MKAKKTKPTPSRLTLRAKTAADLMTRDPLSVREGATLREAVAFLTDHGFSAAPVIDKAGRAVGVLSQSDIVIHDRETVRYVPEAPEYYSRTELRAYTGEGLGAGFQVEEVDPTRVRDVMTQVVFSVAPETPARAVVENMLQLAVHRLFVIDRDGVLVGVVSAFDVLRHLKPDRTPKARAADKVPAVGCEPW